MAVKYLSIALLITLQAAISFCASTQKPMNNFEGTMESYYYTDNYIHIRYTLVGNIAVIIGVIIGVLGGTSLIIGVFMIVCCKKLAVRPGHIVNTYPAGQEGTVQQPGTVSYVASGATVAMPSSPPYPVQAQQQNVYPVVQPAYTKN